jgi:serine/threonine-protein kinase
VTYECVTGSVPFPGTNGPSILLAILTKDPVPPTVKGKDAPLPPPPTMDDVIELALAKNQNIRTKTVGALADAVGHAYGLEGDHRQWATVPQQELARRVEEARPRVMAPRVAALEAAGDPFAAPPMLAGAGAQAPRFAGAGAQPPRFAGAGAPDPFAAPLPGTAPMPVGAGAGGYVGADARMAMDQAYAATREASFSQNFGGVPGVVGRPAWLLPVIIGAAALIFGGVVTLVVMLVH